MRRAMRITVAVGLAAALTGAAVKLTADQSPQVVQLRDDCDAATFNAAIGDGTCNPNAGGDTTFQDFLAEVSAQHSADKWRFNPDRISDPRNIVAQNRGGETHTFTHVANFGDGSIAPPLNAVLGTTDAD